MSVYWDHVVLWEHVSLFPSWLLCTHKADAITSMIDVSWKWQLTDTTNTYCIYIAMAGFCRNYNSVSRLERKRKKGDQWQFNDIPDARKNAADWFKLIWIVDSFRFRSLSALWKIWIYTHHPNFHLHQINIDYYCTHCGSLNVVSWVHKQRRFKHIYLSQPLHATYNKSPNFQGATTYRGTQHLDA